MKIEKAKKIKRVVEVMIVQQKRREKRKRQRISGLIWFKFIVLLKMHNLHIL